MPLVLQPKIADKTFEELVAHVAEVQSRRMLAALEFHQGKNAKLDHESDKIQRRVTQQYTMLEKEILALDRSIEKVEKRMHEIESMKQELNLIEDMKEDTQ